MSEELKIVELQNIIYNSKNFTRRRLHQLRYDWVTGSIERCANKKNGIQKAIEYGPGSGIYLPKLQLVANSVVAADIEMAHLNAIRSNCEIKNIDLEVDDIQDTNFNEGEFDLVLCTEVLEHVPHPELAIKSIYKILKPGGFAVITTPQKYSLLEIFCKIAFLPLVIDFVRLVYREPILETGHISLKTHNEFARMLRSNGFETLDFERFGLYIPFLAEVGGGGLIKFIETKIANKQLFSWMLWTQCYVLKKPI